MKRAGLVWVVLLGSTFARADLPGEPPERREVFSANRAFRLDVETGKGEARAPAAAATSTGVVVTYERGARVTARTTFQKGKLASVELETQAGQAPAARLRLFKVGASAQRWQTELEFLPGSALVADSGSWVATFDAGDSSGPLGNVVVLFDAAGKKRWALTLNDLFTAAEQERLTHSTHGIFWAAGMFEGDKVPHRFSADEKELILKVQLDGYTRPNLEQPAAHERRVELATGKVRR